MALSIEAMSVKTSSPAPVEVRPLVNLEPWAGFEPDGDSGLPPACGFTLRLP